MTYRSFDLGGSPHSASNQYPDRRQPITVLPTEVSGILYLLGPIWSYINLLGLDVFRG